MVGISALRRLKREFKGSLSSYRVPSQLGLHMETVRKRGEGRRGERTGREGSGEEGETSRPSPNGICRMSSCVSLEVPKADTKASFHVQETCGGICKDRRGGVRWLRETGCCGSSEGTHGSKPPCSSSVPPHLRPTENVGGPVRKLPGGWKKDAG